MTTLCSIAFRRIWLYIFLLHLFLSPLESFRTTANNPTSTCRPLDLLFRLYSSLEQRDLTHLDVIYDDEDVIAIKKPSGVVSMPCASASSATAAHIAADYLRANMRLREAEGILASGIVHILDKEVSGLILLAKNKKARKILSRRFSNREVAKKYIAIVHGQYRDPNQQDGDETSILTWPIYRKSSGKAAIALTEKEKEKAKDASTGVTVLASNGTYSLLEVEIDTGRYHQIRVHLAHAGYPLVGDSEYCYTVRTMASGAQVQAFSPSSKGGRKMGGLWLNKHKRVMLHSFSISIAHPLSEQNMELHCVLPMDMKVIASDLANSCGVGDKLWYLWQD